MINALVWSYPSTGAGIIVPTMLGDVAVTGAIGIYRILSCYTIQIDLYFTQCWSKNLENNQ